MLLSLRPNDFGIYSFGSFILILAIFLIVYLLFILVPPLIIANAIMKHNNQNKFSIEVEEEDYFRLSNGIRLYKRYYDKEYDYYETPFGYFIPVYNWNDNVIAFIRENRTK